MSPDYAVRALSKDGHVRALAARTTQLAEEGRRRHDAWPTAAAALGRALTGAGLLAQNIKDGGSIALRFLGDGPLGGMVAEGRPDGKVRGYVKQPHVDLPLNARRKLDVGGAVGEGELHVVRDLGLRQPYTGSAPLVSGEIADDLTHYLARSEQVPSLVSLGVLVAPEGHVQAAGGAIVQLMPGAPKELVTRLEENAQALAGISHQIEAGRTPEEVLKRAMAGLAFEIKARTEMSFVCGCSRERTESVLISLGREELQSMLEEDGEAEVRCHFCNEVYHFAAGDLERLLKI